jgi:hypothetical protein
VDRLLRSLVTRAFRRGLAGEPIWLAVAVGAWLVRRARNAGPEVIWQGRVSPGQRLVVTTTDPSTTGGSNDPAASGGSGKG